MAMFSEPAPPLRIFGPVSASELARRYGLELVGEDCEIDGFALLTNPMGGKPVSYAGSERWLTLAHPDLAAIIVPDAAWADAGSGRTLLVCPGRDPEVVFFEMLTDSLEQGFWAEWPTAVADSAQVHPSAVIEPGVSIGERSQVMAGAVVHAGTRIGSDVLIKPQAVVGGDGFQVRQIRGRRRIVQHAGGVVIGDGSAVGAQTCIDRGLFGESTVVGTGTMIDNLVQVGHMVRIGAGVTIVAGVEISGVCQIGDGAWIAPQSSMLQFTKVGEYARVSMGSVLTHDVPAYTRVGGVPARVNGWSCKCGADLDSGAIRARSAARCACCGRCYERGDSDALAPAPRPGEEQK